MSTTWSPVAVAAASWRSSADTNVTPDRLSGDHVNRSTLQCEDIERAVCEVFSFKPAAIIKQLNLLRPIYSKTTNYGHFGKNDPDITWEKADKVDALRQFAVLVEAQHLARESAAGAGWLEGGRP